jgi:nucleoside-diphosphate-sugar epimerase
MFNVGTGIETSANQLKDIIFATMGKSVPVTCISMDAHLVRRRLASTAKIREKLGFVPNISVTDGVRRYVDALLSSASAVHAS